MQTWWDHHHHPNILLLHYSDLLADLPAQIARIATFLGIEIDAPRLATVVAAVNIDAMRLHSNLYVPCGGVLWQGGAATFLYRGSNGRWRGVLSAEQLEAYDRVSREALSPACHAWLHGGRSETELSFDHC